ncbi:MAG: YggS family pyridoxal phosphate-dependent enzyme [Gammaproteobacteria bacterium]|nr:YggS family pyridoxal phosphate-dependent enzyme [Gammaproteobacteria bacterium]
MGPQNLPVRIGELRERIARAAAEAGRSAHSITLLAAAKGHPPGLLDLAADCGVSEFGESYLQEGLAKIDALRNRPLTWHFIGRVQSNKTRAIAAAFAWVHTVDRLRIAERLSAQRPDFLPPLNVCLEVNIAGEASKGGIAPQTAAVLAAAVDKLPRLALRGLMCIPPEESEVARQRSWFARLRALRDTLDAGGSRLDTLSMGMSGDFEAAILEGATIVRIGTALFGPRR